MSDQNDWTAAQLMDYLSRQAKVTILAPNLADVQGEPRGEWVVHVRHQPIEGQAGCSGYGATLEEALTQVWRSSLWVRISQYDPATGEVSTFSTFDPTSVFDARTPADRETKWEWMEGL